MAGVFHVEFGINETPLTQVLNKQDFIQAEKIIRENAHESYLNEGFYQRTPLYIVLCGTDEEQEHARTRNLFLAKLLVEHGADINHRVPATSFGSEFLGPGKTSLELLIDFYNDLTKVGSHQLLEPWYAYSGEWDPTHEVVIGLTKQVLHEVENVINHIEDLIFIILSNGANPNVLDVNRMTPLHKTVILSNDIRLTKILCENGVNVNAVDRHGNTPLHALCDISVSEMYDYLDDLSPASEDTLEDASATLCIKADFVDYLLEQHDIQVNIQNNKGQTALFHAVIRGDMRTCKKLLLLGADPSLRGTVWVTKKRKRKVSSLFVSFMSIPVQRTLSWKTMYHKLTAAPQQFAPLVDAGFFTQKEIIGELHEYLEHDFPEFLHLRSLGTQLLHMMFGRGTASLQQLAARTIFHQCLIKNNGCLSKIIPVESMSHQFTSEDFKQCDVYDDYVMVILNRTVLQTLILKLSLPQDSLMNFEAELVLHRMASKFSTFKAFPPDDIFNYMSDDSMNDSEDTDSSLEQDEGDSDLEYW